MNKLPIFIDIEDKNIIVVGGGNAAFIKIKTLIDFNCKVTVIAPLVLNEIRLFAEQGLIKILIDEFEERYLKDIFIVVSCADSETNKKVYEASKRNGILCCVCGKGQKGDFIFPAHKKEGDITVAVSTNGRYPLLAKKICKKIDLNISAKLDFLYAKRQFIIENIKDKKMQNVVLNEIINYEDVSSKEFEKRTDAIIEEYLNE